MDLDGLREMPGPVKKNVRSASRVGKAEQPQPWLRPGVVAVKPSGAGHPVLEAFQVCSGCWGREAKWLHVCYRASEDTRSPLTSIAIPSLR